MCVRACMCVCVRACMCVCVCVCAVCFDYCMSVSPSLIMPLFISCSQLRELLQSHPDDEELLQVGSAPLAGVSYITVMVLQRHFINVSHLGHQQMS